MGPTSPERGTKLGEGAGPRAEPGHTQCTNGPAAGGLGELGPCEHPHASPLAPALSWGGFPHCWHPPQLPCWLERAGAHPHPYGTAGAGIIPNPCQHREQETPLGGTVLGAARPTPSHPHHSAPWHLSPRRCHRAVVLSGRLSVQLGCCPATKPCAAPLRPPAHPTQLFPPLPPAAATSFPAGTKSSSFHPKRGCAGGEGGTHLQGGLGPPYRSVGGSSSPLLGPCGARFCPVGHLGDTLGSQLSPLVHLEGIWRSHLLPMGHLSGTDESQHSPMGHLGGSVLSYGATGGHWGSWFIPIGHLEVPVLPYGALGNKFPP